MLRLDKAHPRFYARLAVEWLLPRKIAAPRHGASDRIRTDDIQIHNLAL
jgi:hypothetical protein